MMSFDRSGGFYSAPFPSDDLRAGDGTIDLSGFPNPNSATLITSALSLASTTGGFGRSSGIFFQASTALNPASLPTLAGSAAPGASVFVIGIDPSSPDYLVRHVVEE